MEVTIKFTDAMANVYKNPTQEWFKRIVFNCNPRIWEWASGDSLLLFMREDGARATMLLIGRKNLGFIVAHSWGGERPRQALVNSDASGEIVEVYIGGDPAPYWKRNFVSREQAWEAIEHFMKTGERKSAMKWEPFNTACNCDE